MASEALLITNLQSHPCCGRVTRAFGFAEIVLYDSAVALEEDRNGTRLPLASGFLMRAKNHGRRTHERRLLFRG